MPNGSTPERKTIFTIGHSTRTLEELIALLKRHGIARLVDIRHFPTSRHNPQFDKSVLEPGLRAQGLDYIWHERLGGYRRGGYLSYMETAEFQSGLAELERLAGEAPAAIMCAELKWWQCHRRRVSDALVSRSWEVVHLMTERRTDAHRLKTNRIKCD